MSFTPFAFDGQAWSPVSKIPDKTYGGVVSPAGMTYITEEDFHSPTPPAGGFITNVFSGNVSPAATTFSVGYGNYPTVSPGVTIPSYDVFRIHDFSGGSASWRWTWAKIETVQGVKDWGNMDSCVDQNLAAGKKLSITLWGTPTWASARPAEIGAYGAGYPGASAEAANLANFSAWCTALATRYAGKIKYYEVWNEPNSSAFFSGTQTMLAQITRLANQAIKAVDPAAQIVAAPVTSMQSGGSGLSYFLSMMQASDGAAGTMKDWVDAVSCHMYPSQGKVQDIPGMISGMRAHMATLGVSALPLFNTEFSRINPDFGTLSQSVRENSLRAMMTLTSAHNQGAPQWNSWYGLDHTTFLWTKDDVAVYEDHRELMAKGITVINVLADGRVAAVVGGRKFLWAL